MTVYEQLTEYCDCLSVEVDGVDVPNFNEREVDELIYLISSYTCWANKPCETFLAGERKELVDLPDCVRECDVYEFEPFYVPFDPESFTFTLIEQNGIQENIIPISTYVYSTADEKFRLELPLPECKCRPRCGCKSNYKLMVKYVAGYEEIPDCLLPVFCEALQWIIKKNECDCEKCDDCDKPYTQEKRIDYTSLTGMLQEHFLNILAHQYFRQLSLISLCGKRNKHLWAVVS